MIKKPAVWLFWSMGALALVADQLSKWLIFERWLGGGAVRASMPDGYATLDFQRALAAARGVEVVPGYFYLAPQVNPGVVWGLFGDWPGVVLLVGALASAAVIFYFYRYAGKSRVEALGLGAVLGGAIGNIIDRAAFHNVRDFILLAAGRWQWPTFNIADSFITVGAVLLIMAFLLPANRAGR